MEQYSQIHDTSDIKIADIVLAVEALRICQIDPHPNIVNVWMGGFFDIHTIEQHLVTIGVRA
jgi:hypothetical protein